MTTPTIYPEHYGPCAKARVRCTLVTPDGEHFVGENWCKTPQATCPRAPGEGYEKCTAICNQVGHAETVALMIAGDKAKGAKAYLEFHTYACRNCQETLFDAGVESLARRAPPAPPISLPIATHDTDEHMGFMYLARRPCGKVSASAWDESDTKPEEMQRSIKEWQARGDTVERVERFRSDPQPDWMCSKSQACTCATTHPYPFSATDNID